MQFYLDQAKQLKDNFNIKYPDDVYGRCPNDELDGAPSWAGQVLALVWFGFGVLIQVGGGWELDKISKTTIYGNCYGLYVILMPIYG